MITSNASTTEVQSTMSGKQVAMGIRAEDMGQIMSILTDLYEDSLLAIIREYSTNAWDAHQEAGVKLPIEVSLPSRFTPALSIRDYGVGMTADEIEQVYAQYGRSTKRDTNSQGGMFGLGCKSALTYSDQFTVVSNKDGRKVTVVVSRDDDGAGQMQIIGDEPTQEGNGTEIVVAIQAHHVSDCAERAQRFYQYWPKGSVSVKGAEIKHFADDPELRKINDSLYIRPRAYNSKGDLVIMGNVAYPVTIERDFNRGQSYDVIAIVPIGAVTPAPSREALRDTKQTVAALAQVAVDLHDGLTAAAQAEVAAAPTLIEAIKVYSDWMAYVDAKVTYNGEAIQSTWQPEDNNRDGYAWIRTTSCSTTYNKSATNSMSSEYTWHLNQMIWITDYEPAKLTAVHKNKMLKWAQDKGIHLNKSRCFVLLDAGQQVPTDMVEDKHVVDWQTIKDIKLPRPPRTVNAGPKRLTGSYDIVKTDAITGRSATKDEVPVADLPTTSLYFMHGNNHAGCSYHKLLMMLGHTDAVLVCLPGNRVEKFKRDVPHAQDVHAVTKAGVLKMLTTLTRGERVELDNMLDWRYAYRNNNTLESQLDPKRIDDPELAKRCVGTSKKTASNVATVKHAYSMGIESTAIADAGIKEDDDYEVTDYYPMASIHFPKEDLYLYINAVYAARKGAKA